LGDTFTVLLKQQNARISIAINDVEERESDHQLKVTTFSLKTDHLWSNLNL